MGRQPASQGATRQAGARRQGATRRQQASVAALRTNAGVHHAGVVALTGALFALFWFTRLEWTPDMRLWRAIGDASIVLLFLSLAMGPAARLSAGAAKVLPWRRAVGIWAAVTAIVHGVLVFWGWTQWSVPRLLGYEFIPELGRTARLEPGFGLANLMGVVALVWLIAMLATSFDRAVRALGPGGWKWLHTSAYVVFYLSALHAAYFLFMHYTVSFHRAVPPPNWFRFPLLVLSLAVVALQLAAFVVTRNRRSAGRTAAA